MRQAGQLTSPGSRQLPLAGLLLSLLLHLLIWLLWPVGESRRANEEARGSLRIRLHERSPEALPAPGPDLDRASRTKLRRAPGSRPSLPPAAAVTPDSLAVAGPPDGEMLAAAAKARIDLDSRRQMLDPMFAPPVRNGAPALSPLARALGVPVVGESRIGDRLYQFTTAGGRRFCVSVPPGIDLASNDLPIPARSLVPTNCPQ